MQTGTLFLLPNTLGVAHPAQPLFDVIPVEVQKITASLSHFVAENAKTTRAYLKLVHANYPLALPLQEISISELNINTKETELPALLGCVVEDGSVKVNAAQQTSIEGIYCAGESAGLGGVDTALFEGQIAGHAAAGQTAEAGQLYSSIAKAKSFAAKLNATFQPRAELRILAQAGTVVCRCEDVTFANLKRANSWRSAKLHERCGMGPCQGRICGPAVRFVLGWEPSSVRPPLFPTRIENLIQESSIK